MLGGVTRPMLPHLPGVPHLHVNRLLDWQKKKNFARASPFFVHFSVVVERLRHETFKFHAPGLWSGWAQHKNFLFLLLNLDTVLLDLTQKISPTFDKLNEIK